MKMKVCKQIISSVFKPTLKESVGVISTIFVPLDGLGTSLADIGYKQRSYFATKNLVCVLENMPLKRRHQIPNHIDAACFNVGFGLGIPLGVKALATTNNPATYSLVAAGVGLSARSFYRKTRQQKIINLGGKESAVVIAIASTLFLDISPNLTASAYWIGAGLDAWHDHKKEQAIKPSLFKFFNSDSRVVVPTQVTLNTFLLSMTSLMETSTEMLTWNGIGFFMPVCGLLHGIWQNVYNNYNVPQKQKIR